MDAPELIAALRAQANPANVAGMARFGINASGTLGVAVANIRKLARQARRTHEVADELWRSGIHEARILATIVERPADVTRRQMDRWASQFDSWDVCDQACMNLFRYTPFAFEKAVEWSRSDRAFVRRAAFALMASLAAQKCAASDEQLEQFFPLIVEAATDERNFVRKAVNWALRGIGKRNPRLRARAIATARKIAAIDSSSARWIASDALRELNRSTE